MNRQALSGSRLLPVLIFAAATVLFAYLGFAFAERSGVWFAGAGFCLASALAFGLLYPHLHRAFELDSRRRQYQAIVEDLTRVLACFKLPSPNQRRLDRLVSEAPGAGEDLVNRGCREVAAELGGDTDPAILELLYRSENDLGTTSLWGRTTAGQRRELAELLAASGRWSGFEVRQMTAVLAWILGRLGELRLEVIDNELGRFELLWNHLYRYSKRLEVQPRNLPVEGLLEELLEQLDRSLDGALLSATDFGELAETVLVEISRPWIRAGAGGASVRSMEVDGSTLVALGIFTAEVVASDLPLLEHLGLRVARQPMTLRMLFGYLWKKSLDGEEAAAANGLSRLATDWDEWATAAEAEIGGGLSDAVHRELRTQLLHRVWPTWLPFAATIGQLARQSEALRERRDELAKAAVRRSPGEHAEGAAAVG